jgi:hypothetical protein
MLRGLSRAATGRVLSRNMTGPASYEYTHLEVSQPSEFVFRLAHGILIVISVDTVLTVVEMVLASPLVSIVRKIVLVLC